MRSHFRDNVAVILPWLDDPKVGLLKPYLDGFAPLLVAYITDKPHRILAPLGQLVDSLELEPLTEEEGADKEGLETAGDDASFYTTLSQATSSSILVTTIDMPFSAHLLPGNGKHVDAVLLVVAVVYHRSPPISQANSFKRAKPINCKHS